MKKKTLLIIFVLTVAGVSCKTKSQNNKIVTFDKFPVENKLKEIEFYDVSNTSVQGLFLFHDTLLLMNIEPNKSTHLFSTLNISSKKLSNPVIPFGRKRGQSFGFLCVGVHNDYLWGYDVSKNIVLLYNMDSVLRNSQYISSLEYKLRNNYYFVSVLGDSKLLASGDYTSDYKLAFVDLQTGNTTSEIIPYNIKTTSQKDWYEKHAGESFLFVKPDGKKAVLAKRYADEIEIVDLKTGYSQIIRGPEGFLPDFKRMTTPGGLEVAVPNERARYSFTKSCVTNKYIYLMFSGNTLETEHRFYGNSIYVFDWNGKPIKKLILNTDRSSFAVTTDDKTIYLLDPNKNKIYVATIQ